MRGVGPWLVVIGLLILLALAVGAGELVGNGIHEWNLP